MNATLRERQLRALDVEPLRLRRIAAEVSDPVAGAPTAALHVDVAPPAATSPATQASVTLATAPARVVRKLALLPDSAELADPAIRTMYAALTEAVGKAGLQRVRVCDVAVDAEAMVMAFGAAPFPEGVPAVRVLRVDPLAVLLVDRERKRLLWEQMLALGRGTGG